jgi:hypothetical protein
MNELTKTLIFIAGAVVLAAAAVVIDPGTSTPEVFSDQGEVFFPQFTDPQAPKTIEVIDYDEATATARPLKVEFKDNKWRIPSHFNYPADAEKRLSQTAAALLELHKDIIISDRIEDHAEYGVVDPLDPKASSHTGRGKRVTLRDANDTGLADFIVGKAVEDKPGHHYMRVTNQRRVYAVKTSADISAKFEDWIETDLLKIIAGDIERIHINNYSINERMGTIDQVEKLEISKNDDKWRISGGGTPTTTKMNDLTGALDNLRIVDVQPKPENLGRDLKTTAGIQITQESFVSLQQKGFFIIPATGQLFSNEGEIIVETKNGLQYTLRFGEIASGGSDEQKPAPAQGEEAAAPEEPKSDQTERRYLFITVNYSEALAKKYAGEGKEPDQKGSELANELRERFADWYYVISGADFGKLRPRKSELMRG